MISKGMSITMTEKVTENNTARALGSGTMNVYATPAMALLVEKAAVTMLMGNLDGNMTSVGTGLTLEHIAASPVGSEITCELTLSKIDRKQITFDFEVRDEFDLVGRGTHSRFLVDEDRFQAKADSKII